MKKPLILVTNDDGITAPGLRTLIHVMNKLGEVVVVAPDSPQSGMGHAITISDTLYSKKEKIDDGPQTEYSISGTPADCVKFAIREILDRKPDLCVSGINHGANSSINVIYSGTMSAAIEAGIEGIKSIGFSDKNELDGRYLDTSEKNFLQTLNISCFSFTSIAQRAEKLMKNGGSLLTLTYYGAEKVMPHYNVMGIAKAGLETSVKYLAKDLGSQNIRVNAISAGPIKTLAASGIGDFRYILKWNEYNSPLKRTVSIDEVGNSALYLLSDLSSGVTGEIHHVDSGYNVIGMKSEDAPDISTV